LRYADAFLAVLNEEWEHRLYPERDLDVLGIQSVLGKRTAYRSTVRN